MTATAAASARKESPTAKQSNAYAQRFGLHLLPDLYEAYNPMSYRAAVDMEIALGICLRQAGFGVWQG